MVISPSMAIAPSWMSTSTVMRVRSSLNEFGNRIDHGLRLKRFDDPCLRARGAAFLLFVFARFSRQHDDGREFRRGVFLYFLQETDAIHDRHVHVADD